MSSSKTTAVTFFRVNIFHTQKRTSADNRLKFSLARVNLGYLLENFTINLFLVYIYTHSIPKKHLNSRVNDG